MKLQVIALGYYTWSFKGKALNGKLLLGNKKERAWLWSQLCTMFSTTEKSKQFE